MRAFQLNENHLERRNDHKFTEGHFGKLLRRAATLLAHGGSSLRSLVIAVVIGDYFNESPKKNF